MRYDAKTNTYLQSKNDCVIVSISNFLKLDYARVIKSLYDIGGMTAIERLPKRGVLTPDIGKMLENLTNTKWVIKTPRRGQDKFVGFASWHVPNRRKGHMTIIIGNVIKDTDGNTYNSLEEYRVKYNYVLRGIFTPEI